LLVVVVVLAIMGLVEVLEDLEPEQEYQLLLEPLTQLRLAQVEMVVQVKILGIMVATQFLTVLHRLVVVVVVVLIRQKMVRQEEAEEGGQLQEMEDQEIHLAQPHHKATQAAMVALVLVNMVQVVVAGQLG
jgi:hypothetical protein